MVSLSFFALKNKIDSFSRSWRGLGIIISQIQKINNAYFLLHVYSKERNSHGSNRERKEELWGGEKWKRSHLLNTLSAHVWML